LGQVVGAEAEELSGLSNFIGGERAASTSIIVPTK